MAVLLEPGRIELREEARPAPQAGEILVRVRAALTDGTDLKTYRRGHPQMPTPPRFGHEFAGDVAAVGEGVTAFASGDPVMCVHTAPCRACFWCAQGEEELCERLMSTMVLGAYADYVTLPRAVVEQNCFHKPADMSYREAAFLEPLSCVVHSVETARPRGSVAIVGDGAFGLLHALMLRERGLDAILIGRRAERLERARSYGFDPVDARATDVVRAVRERTGGRGADTAIECTGTQSAWEEAPSLVRRGGTVSLFGGLAAGSRVAFDASRLHYDEIRLFSPFHFTPRAVGGARNLLIERRFDVAPLITRTYPLGEIADAFARLDAGEGMKVCIEP